MPEAEQPPMRDNPEVTHERSDVNVRVITAFGLGLAILALVVHLGLYWLLNYYERSAVRRAPAPSAIETEPPIPRVPRLQVSPQSDLAEMRAAEEQVLQSYGWIDKERQIARIPIERAMELLAKRALPARKQTSEK